MVISLFFFGIASDWLFFDQLSLLELVFNGTKHMILLISKDCSSLVVYPQSPQLVLLEDGWWVEAIAPFPLNSALVLLPPFILPVLNLWYDIIGVDNVLQFTIVLANGSLITTNSFQYPDLFWALRGGGGGTYGIVTSTTYQTHPTFPIVGAVMLSNFPSLAIAQNVTTEFIKLLPTLSDEGWGGYSGISNSTFSAMLVGPNISWADANATFLPFAQYVEDATGGSVIATTIPFPSFYEFYKIFFSNPGQVGSNVEIASRLLPRSLAETDPAKAAEIILSIDVGVGMK
jgi:hypothetical protein